MHRLAEMGLGERDQGGGGVEGGDRVAELGKGLCIAAGAAAGVEDLRLVPQQREEAAIERSHVDFDGIGEESVRVLLIIILPWVRHGEACVMRASRVPFILAPDRCVVRIPVRPRLPNSSMRDPSLMYGRRGPSLILYVGLHPSLWPT